MPLIGITSCRKLDDYQHSVVHAGGEVRILAPSEAVDEVMSTIDGLLLTGGGDIAPERYGEGCHPSVVNVEPARDEMELALVQKARARCLPILAICRGVQVLNVACGGTLVRDIPSEITGALAHNLLVPPHQASALAHEIWIDKNSLLATLMSDRLKDEDACDANSRHHQAIKKVAPGFVVSATAPDGMVEAIEDPTMPFCLGVQWHPENFWRTGEFRALFEGFVTAAQLYSDSKA